MPLESGAQQVFKRSKPHRTSFTLYTPRELSTTSQVSFELGILGSYTGNSPAQVLPELGDRHPEKGFLRRFERLEPSTLPRTQDQADERSKSGVPTLFEAMGVPGLTIWVEDKLTEGTGQSNQTPTQNDSSPDSDLASKAAVNRPEDHERNAQATPPNRLLRVEIRNIRSMECFGPDWLVKNIPELAKLLATRDLLAKAKLTAKAEKELRALLQTTKPKPA